MSPVYRPPPRTNRGSSKRDTPWPMANSPMERQPVEFMGHWAGDREGSALIASTCFEFFRHARGEIGQNPVTPGPLERRQALDNGALAVEPAVLRRRHDHRVFAGHLVGEGRHPEDFF